MKHAVLGETLTRKNNTMGDRSPGKFDTEEKGWNDKENVEEEEEPEDEPEEEEKEEENSSSSEQEGEVDDDEPDYDPWDPLRKQVGWDLKESYMEEVKRFLDGGKTQDFAETAALNALLPVSIRKLRKNYLQR